MATKAAIGRTAAQPARAQRRGSMIQRGLLYALAIICAIGFTVPFIWTIGTSLKPLTDLYTYPPKFIPSAPRWENYNDVFTLAPFATFLWNSVIITALAVFGQTLSAAVVAYGFSLVFAIAAYAAHGLRVLREQRHSGAIACRDQRRT